MQAATVQDKSYGRERVTGWLLDYAPSLTRSFHFFEVMQAATVQDKSYGRERVTGWLLDCAPMGF